MFKNFLNTRFIGQQVIYLPKCHSTNDMAAELVSSGNYSTGLVVITDYQTAGRGQQGNRWESEAGKNLMFTLALKPESLNIEKIFYINITICLGIHDAFRHLACELSIKWPNDIYAGNKKLGGILIENSIRSLRINHSLAGIGINVNQELFSMATATSLKMVFNREFEREELLERIIRGIDSRYEQLLNSNFELLKNDYLKVLYGYRKPMHFKAGNKFEGIITGVDESGRLQIKSGNMTRSFGIKGITFLD